MYFTNIYVSILNIFRNGVEATLDVPGFLVKPGLLGKGNSSSVVIEESHVSYLGLQINSQQEMHFKGYKLEFIHHF